jgi:hypothetical protein
MEKTFYIILEDGSLITISCAHDLYILYNDFLISDDSSDNQNPVVTAMIKYIRDEYSGIYSEVPVKSYTIDDFESWVRSGYMFSQVNSIVYDEHTEAKFIAAASSPVGCCPVCNSDNIDYGVADFEGDQICYPCTCNQCHATFEEWYDLSFCGHENIVKAGEE